MDLAWPDAGVPMLAFTWPAMALALLPVVLVEWFVARGRLELGRSTVAKGIVAANLCSLSVGVPLGWAAWFALGVLTEASERIETGTAVSQLKAAALQAAWLTPDPASQAWKVPLALVVLLLPIFLITLPIEVLVCAAVWKPARRRTVLAAVLAANVFSFALLAAFALAHLARAGWDQAWAGV